tara:strand:+ start:185 stop:553 length:369 start_codon:yes stop_codon:yes gene_type:complete
LFIIIKGLRSLIQRYLHDQSKKERETEKKTTEWTKQNEQFFVFFFFELQCFVNKVLFPNENYKHQTIGDMCTNVIASESWMEPPKMRQPKMRRLCRRCKKAIQNKHFGGRTNKSPWFICFVI